MIHVIAQIQTRSGARDAFLTEFHKLVPKVLAEAGCLSYEPAIDAETDFEKQICDENTVTIIEQWESLDALKSHLAMPHMNEYRQRVKDYVAGVKLHVLKPTGD